MINYTIYKDGKPATQRVSHKSVRAQQLTAILLSVVFLQVGINYSGKAAVNTKNVFRREISREVKEQPVIRIKGNVSGNNGKPLAGATILIKGTTKGVTSDSKGNFSIVADGDATLVISYLGFKTTEIAINGRTNITVQLTPSLSRTNEVVVIGYGTQTKKTLTGAVSVINSDALKDRPTAKTTDLLQGLSAGLQIVRSNPGNIVGSENKITIRGITSRSAPGVLVVVDGIPQASNNAGALDNINPNDIKSISILKDGQAAIYGARAAGGVILITTKAGQSGTPVLNFSANLTVLKPSLMPKYLNILQTYEVQNAAYVNDGKTTNTYSNLVKFVKDNHITFDDIKKNDQKYLVREPFGNSHPYYLGYYDWWDIMFDPSLQQNYNLSVSGKKNRLSYYESVNYLNEDGMLAHGSNYKRRLLITLKNDYDVSSFLKIKSNFRLGTQKMVEPYNYTGAGYGGFQGVLFFTQTTLQPRTEGGHFMDIGGFYSPLGMALAHGNTTDRAYMLHGTLGFELTPLEGLLVSGNLSANYNLTETDWANLDFPMYDPLGNFVQTAQGGLNEAGAGYSRVGYTVGNINATYSYHKLRNQDVKLLVGYSQETDNYREFSAHRRYGQISPGLPTMGAGAATEQYNGEEKNAYGLNSAYARLAYNFKSRYLFEGIFRYDGSSKFAKGFRWSPFLGLSGGWVVSEEGFMKNLTNVIDFLKVRASWGQLGNQSGIGLYDYVYPINVGGGYPLGAPDDPAQAQMATLGALPSTTRTWEKIESKNIGINFGISHSRLTGSFDYYIKDNKNMFFNREFPEVLGATPPNINGAFLRTKGWELEIGWKDEVGNFNYFVKFNLSNNNTKVIRLADDVIPRLGTNDFVEGNPYMSYWGFQYEGLIKSDAELQAYKQEYNSGIPANIKLGDPSYKDMNGDGKLTAEPFEVDKEGKPTATSGDLVRIGEGGQHGLFGVTVGCSWKNFDFSAFFQGVLKWQIISPIIAVRAWYEPIESYLYHQTWAPDRPDALYPRSSLDGTLQRYNYQYSAAPYKLFNDRYVRLKNLQVAYNLPKQISNKLDVDNVRVYFSGTDLWEVTNLIGNQDPETPFSRLRTPFPRQFSFGLSLTF